MTQKMFDSIGNELHYGDLVLVCSEDYNQRIYETCYVISDPSTASPEQLKIAATYRTDEDYFTTTLHGPDGDPWYLGPDEILKLPPEAKDRDFFISLVKLRGTWRE